MNTNNNVSGGRYYVDPADLTMEEMQELCLVGTLLTDKPVRFHAMKERLASLWRPGQGVTI
ncbi:hypothetical protein A2U01_0077403, partial [Trifolium medium]|nr:hypothetical protein [Trifolium medium]